MCVCVCVFVYIHTAACEFTMNIELRCARSYPEAETAHHSHVWPEGSWWSSLHWTTAPSLLPGRDLNHTHISSITKLAGPFAPLPITLVGLFTQSDISVQNNRLEVAAMKQYEYDSLWIEDRKQKFSLQERSWYSLVLQSKPRENFLTSWERLVYSIKHEMSYSQFCVMCFDTE